MGGSWFIIGTIGMLALTASACARKDRIAPCAPGEGLVASYASQEPVFPSPLVVSADGSNPCGPLRRLNASPLVSLAEE
ncbi:MAG: hypothetical protein ACRCTI_20320 [Beijerinckiaceae bacterium]